ncbi:RNA polymerase sigma factor, partial [Actinomadura rubrisoli]
MPRLSPSVATADRKLVKGLNEGDEAALAALYDEYGERLYDYALSMSADEKVAAGIVHDTFIDACRRAPRMRDHLHLSSWLYGAARRRCIRRGRAGELFWDRDGEFSDSPFLDRTEFEAAEAAEDAAALESAGGSLRDGAESELPPPEELHHLLRTCLARLDPVDQEVVLLAFRHGLRPARLGAALGMSARRAAMRVRRGRTGMEAALDAELLRATRECAARRRPAEDAPSQADPAREARPTAVAVLATRNPSPPPPAAAPPLAETPLAETPLAETPSAAPLS